MSQTQIDSLNIRIESTSRDATAAIDALIQSFEKLKAAGNFSSIEKSLKKISDATNKGLKNIPATFNKAAKSADKLSDSMKDAAGSAGGLKSALSGAVSGLLQFVGNAMGINSVGDALIATTQAAMEWEGISARFGEGFGEQANEAYEWVLKLQDALYINDQQFMQYASNFATLGKGMGVPTKYIKDMSIGMTELAYDIFAKNNDFYDLEEALLAVRSAFLGEIEPIRKAGISITEATLKEAAANYGLTTSVEKMTEAQKMQLRYKVMLDQAYASGTVGTYAAEIDTAEGSFRALGQQMKGLAQTIGGLLMPVVSAVLPYLQAFVSLITMAIRAVASFFGISIKAPTWGMDSFAASAGSAAEAVDDTTDALGGAAKAAKKLKDYTMGFDELNVIKPPEESKGGGGGGVGGGIGGDLGLDIDSLWTDAMIAEANMKAEQVKQNILNALKPIGDAIGLIDFEPLMNSLSRLWEAFVPFAGTIGDGLYWILMNVLIPLAGYTIENVLPTFIDLLASALEAAVPLMERFGAWFVENQDSILTVAGYVAAFFVAFKAVTWITGAISAVGGVSTAVGGLTTFLGNLLIRGQSLAVIFGASGGGIGGVLSVLGSILSSVISAVFSPFSLLVVTIASTAMVLAANWDKVVQVFKNFIDNIDLQGKFDAITAALAPMMEKLSGLGDLFTVIGTIGTTILAAAMHIVAGVFNAVLTALPPLIEAIGGVIDILAGLGEFIVAIFTGDLEKAKESVVKIGTGIKDVFGGLWNAVGGLLMGFVDGVVAFFTGLWDTLVGHSIVPDTINAIVEWFASLPGAILGGLEAFINSVIEWFKTAWSGIQNSWSGVTQWFSDIWSNIKETFSNVGTWFREKFSSAWESIKDVFSSWTQFFSDLWTKIKDTFSGLGTELGDAIGGSIKNAINGVISSIESTINKAIGLINSAISLANKLPGVDVGKLKTISIPRLATGGFVDEGQLFIAREAGAEMVGSMNNRTTVANNDQIVEGISAGVYSAVLAAMSQTNGNNKASINVYLDGKQITAAVEKHQRERGANIMTGGVAFGY